MIKPCLTLALALGLAGFSSGCAMMPKPAPVMAAPEPVPAAIVLQHAEEAAYRQGFAAGAEAQYRHDKALAAAKPAPPLAPAQAQIAPQTAPVVAMPDPPPALPPPPPQSVYAPSGPATPVRDSANPF